MEEPSAKETAGRMIRLYGYKQALERANEHGLANSMGKNPTDEAYWNQVYDAIKLLRKKS